MTADEWKENLTEYKFDSDVAGLFDELKASWLFYAMTASRIGPAQKAAENGDVGSISGLSQKWEDLCAASDNTIRCIEIIRGMTKVYLDKFGGGRHFDFSRMRTTDKVSK